MTIDLYYLPGSAPCTSIRLLAKTLGVDLNLKATNLMKGEHLTPEYLKINPQHTVPTLVDDEFSLWESRAILIYLIEKYGADESLYPKCPQARAIVHRMLFFDATVLYPRFGEFMYPQIFEKQNPDPAKLTKVHGALDFLDTFLESQTFTAGNELTISDYALMTSLITFESASIDLGKHENVSKWLATCREAIGQTDIVDEHVEALQAVFGTVQN